MILSASRQTRCDRFDVEAALGDRHHQLEGGLVIELDRPSVRRGRGTRPSQAKPGACFRRPTRGCVPASAATPPPSVPTSGGRRHRTRSIAAWRRTSRAGRGHAPARLATTGSDREDLRGRGTRLRRRSVRSRRTESVEYVTPSIDELVGARLDPGPVTRPLVATARRFIDAAQAAFTVIARQPGIDSPRYAVEIDWLGLRTHTVRRFPYLIFYPQQCSSAASKRGRSGASSTNPSASPSRSRRTSPTRHATYGRGGMRLDLSRGKRRPRSATSRCSAARRSSAAPGSCPRATDRSPPAPFAPVDSHATSTHRLVTIRVWRPAENPSAGTRTGARTARYRHVAGRSREARWEGFEPPAA
jgi:hypothetical protein